MAFPTRRARHANTLAAATVKLLDDYQVPLPTRAVRVLLNDRGRTVTAEQLSRLAAYEREDFIRTRLPPRLCSVIDASANLVSPRWWARGEWRLQRRILTDDAKQIWLAVLASHLCDDLARRTRRPSDDVRTLVLGTVATLLPGKNDFTVPVSASDWHDLRAEVVSAHPGATHSLEGPTSGQHEAEAALRDARTPGVDLYFGRRR